MHTVDLLDRALAAARSMGFTVREEWLDGQCGGACEIRGKRTLFIDLALSPREQLEQVLEALEGEPALDKLALPVELRHQLGYRNAA